MVTILTSALPLQRQARTGSEGVGQSERGAPSEIRLSCADNCTRRWRPELDRMGNAGRDLPGELTPVRQEPDNGSVEQNISR